MISVPGQQKHHPLFLLPLSPFCVRDGRTNDGFYQGNSEDEGGRREDEIEVSPSLVVVRDEIEGKKEERKRPAASKEGGGSSSSFC